MEQQNQPVFPQPEEVHLWDHLNVILRRWKLVLLVLCAVFLGGVYYTFTQQPVYEASTTIQVQGRDSLMLGEFGMGSQNNLSDDLQILQSRSMAEKVARRLHLDWQISEKPPGLAVDIREFYTRPGNSGFLVELTGNGRFRVLDSGRKVVGTGASGSLTQGKDLSLLLNIQGGQAGDRFYLEKITLYVAAVQVQGSINARQVGEGGSIIRLSCRDIDPVRARDVVNTLAQVYQEQSINVKSQEAGKTIEFIEKQVDAFRNDLDLSERALLEYNVKSGLRVLGPEGATLVNKLSGLEQQKFAVRLRKKGIEYAMKSLEEARSRGKAFTPPAISGEPVPKDATSRLVALEVEKENLLREFTKAHPRVLDVERKIEGMLKQILAAYEAAQEGLTFEENSLAREIASLERELQKLPQAELELARLTRPSKVNTGIYTFLLQKHQEARIAHASTISNVQIIDPAVTPEQPVSPNKKKNLSMGVFAGLFLGVGLAFFLNYMDDTIKDTESAKNILGLPVLAIIPHIPHRKTGVGTGAKKALVVGLQPRSAVAEAFRSLRTGVHFSTIDKGKKVLLVTSSFPGEGKSTVSSNLAMVFAQTGARVLLIGCDLRRPSLHRLFDQDKVPGLTEVLVDDVALEKALHPTGVSGMDFIGAGTSPPNPAELLGSTQMKNLLEELRPKYDHIFLDVPPLLAVTDAAVLTALSDLVLVVLEVGRVPIKAALRMQETLQSLQIPVTGVILNDKSGEGEKYYGYYGKGRYYGYYGYGYGYYYGDQPETTRGWRHRILKVIGKK